MVLFRLILGGFANHGSCLLMLSLSLDINSIRSKAYCINERLHRRGLKTVDFAFLLCLLIGGSCRAKVPSEYLKGGKMSQNCSLRVESINCVVHVVKFPL